MLVFLNKINIGNWLEAEPTGSQFIANNVAGSHSRFPAFHASQYLLYIVNTEFHRTGIFHGRLLTAPCSSPACSWQPSRVPPSWHGSLSVDSEVFLSIRSVSATCLFISIMAALQVTVSFGVNNRKMKHHSIIFDFHWKPFKTLHLVLSFWTVRVTYVVWFKLLWHLCKFPWNFLK